MNSTVRDVETSVEDTQAMIESAETLGGMNRRRSSNLTNQSARLETQVQRHKNVSCMHTHQVILQSLLL